MRSEYPEVCPHCGHQLSMFMEKAPERGERAAIAVASFVGSWWFPGGVLLFVGVWLVVNINFRLLEPYPMVMLSILAVVLATLAAGQGPLILLTQRRAAMRDRERERETLRVTANAEVDLHQLQDRVDTIAAALEARSAD